MSPKRFLDTLEATQEVPRHPRLHSRGTPWVSTQPKEPRFSLLILRGGSVSLLRQGGNSGITIAPQRVPSPFDAGEELQGSSHHFKRPQMLQCTPDTLEFPALNRWSPRSPTQNTMAAVTALWLMETKPTDHYGQPDRKLDTAFLA